MLKLNIMNLKNIPELMKIRMTFQMEEFQCQKMVFGVRTIKNGDQDLFSLATCVELINRHILWDFCHVFFVFDFPGLTVDLCHENVIKSSSFSKSCSRHGSHD